LIRLFLSIAKAMVYQQTFGLYIITVGAYHQPQVASFRNDDIQHSVLMIYRNTLRMIYKACALILCMICKVTLGNKFPLLCVFFRFSSFL
jgi:hypothetical protein